MLKYPMFDEDLSKLSKDGLLRSLLDRTSPQGSKIVIGGREVLNFASNDYLGLASNPALIKAASGALEKYGMGGGASRLMAGGTELCAELEGRVGALKGTGAALLLNSGYAANTGIIPAIAQAGDAIFSDELNHASLVDGCRTSRAEIRIYRHRDMEHLERILKQTWAKRKIIVTDTVFSMDGDIAPLKELDALSSRYNAILYLDDAHATGVLGRGKGSLKHFSMEPEPWIIQMGTFSKAMGSYGAFAAADRTKIEWLVNSARSLIYSTALPACVVAASLEAINILENDSGPVERLWENRHSLFSGLTALGLNTGASETPIIPIIMKSVPEALKLSEQLADAGIYAPAIRPPTVKEPRIRLTVTAAHTTADIDQLLAALGRG
jgi:8-amino-7-oxononanoate synthase